MSNLFLYDTEALSNLVPQNIYQQGLIYFKQERVIEVYEQDKKLFAQVEQVSGQNTESAAAISTSIDQFKRYSDDAVQAAAEMLARAEETSSRNSESAVTISESVNKFNTQVQEFAEAIRIL